MMLNPKISASKKKQGSPRSPLKLKNLNVASSSLSSSSCSSSISSETTSGCLRFFLSHHSSTAFKHVSNKTPKSAPIVRNLRKNVVKKRSNLPNPDNLGKKFSSRYDLSSGETKVKSDFQSKLSNDSANVAKVRKPSSRCDLSDGISKKSSRLQLKFSDKAASLRKPSSRYDLSDGISKKSSGFQLKFSDNAENLRKTSSRYDLSDGMSKFSTGVEVNLSDGTGGFTSVNDFGHGFDLISLSRNNNKCVKLVENDANCGDASRSPTPPPVQASISPEIQGGLTSVMAVTPSTCYAAGHVLSGVTDKRKCRPKGILTIGNNNLFGSSKTKGFRNEAESVVGEVNNRRDSIVPSPTEASVCWLSSPCDEKRSEARDDDDCDGNTNEMRLNQCEKLLPFTLVGCSSSPSSSLGFSSEFHKSNCTISTSDVSSGTPSSRRSKGSLLNSDLSSEFRGVLGPSLDHFVCCPSPPFKVDFSPGLDKFRCDHERQAGSDLEDSFGSGNVMQTPESNSRSPNFDLSELSRNQVSRLWFECELDSMSEVLRRVSVSPDCQLDSPRPSFEFNPLIKLDSSIDLTRSRKAMDTGTPDMSLSLPHCLPEHEVEISCREGSSSRVFEMDELDCCRYLSDEEDDANGCSAASESYGKKKPVLARKAHLSPVGPGIG